MLKLLSMKSKHLHSKSDDKQHHCSYCQYCHEIDYPIDIPKLYEFLMWDNHTRGIGSNGTVNGYKDVKLW